MTPPQTTGSLVREAVEEFEVPLVRYAMSILHDLERARDVVQDTFLRLYQQDEEEIRPKLRSWLFTVCRNRAFDVIKKEKRMIPVEESSFYDLGGPDPSPRDAMVIREREGEKQEELERVYAEMKTLSQNQQDVLRLKFQGELSYKEIAEVTGLSMGNVGFLLHAALKKLRARLCAPESVTN
ncbi:MAG: sigma-70 family RNA polymerase sigma factor [Verrucomicrobiota bacterium]